MATPSHPDIEHSTTPRSLIELVPRDIGSVVIGFEPEPEHLAVHMAPLPDDDRCAAAGLFTMRAQPSWCAVAVVISGRARHAVSGEVAGPAVARLVVSRDAVIASDLIVDGLPLDDPATQNIEGPDHPGAPDGLIVDAVHRMLGIASPGTAPAATAVALAVWGHCLLERALETGGFSWGDAVAMHPGHPTNGHRGGPPVDVSVETVVEATARLADDLDWSRMHRRASSGRSVPPDLTVDEVAWMDPTMYGRWVLGSMPDPRSAVSVLHAEGFDETARRVLQVIDAVQRPGRDSG